MRPLSLWSVVGMLAMLAAGCGGSTDPGVPSDAEPLTDIVSPAGSRSGSFTSFEVAEPSTLYVYNVSGQRLAYVGPLEAGEILKLSWGGVWVDGVLPRSTAKIKPRYERQLTPFDVGGRYRVYIASGVSDEVRKAANAEGSLTTRPNQVRERMRNTVEGQKLLNEK